MVTLLPGLAALLNSAEGTVVRAGIPLIESRIAAKPLPSGDAPVSEVAASRVSYGLFARRGIGLSSEPPSCRASKTARQGTVGIGDP
jgi:hypothetical protein